MIRFDSRGGGKGHYIADAIEDLTSSGWQILARIPFKPGVEQVHARTLGTYQTKPEFNIFYVKTT